MGSWPFICKARGKLIKKQQEIEQINTTSQQEGRKEKSEQKGKKKWKLEK